MKKEELARELFEAGNKWNIAKGGLPSTWEEREDDYDILGFFADFILSRETAMLEEIAHPLREYKCGAEGYTDAEDVIDEALSIIQRRKVDHA
jgi:hypothetical protein